MLRLPTSLSERRAALLRELLLWLFLLPAAFAMTWYFMYPSRAVYAADSPLSSSGVVFYGDSAGVVMRARVFTSTATWATEFSTAIGASSGIQHVSAATAPTREEMMIGNLAINGTLQIQTCTAACNSNGDFTNQWTHSSTTATQDCDTTPTIGTCVQAFDLGYLALNGQGLVVYAADGGGAAGPDADTVYYAFWDGSAWSPDTTPGTPTSSLDLPGSAGTPRWIRVIPDGTKNSNTRSNRAMVLVGDSNSDLHAFYWDGSSFDSGTTLESNLQNDDRGKPFDGAWIADSSTGTTQTLFVVAYNDTAANDVKYNYYTPGTGWSSEVSAGSTASAGYWITADVNPLLSSRIYAITSAQGEDTRGMTENGIPSGSWSTCATGSCPDTSTETVGGMQAGFGAPRTLTSNGVHVYNDAGTNISSGDYMDVSGTTWSTAAGLGFTTTSDDGAKIKAWGNPNNDDVMIIAEDVDCNMFAVQHNGSTLDAVNNNLETDLSDVPATCNRGTPAEGVGAGFPYDFAWKMHNVWQRNWRFFADSDTASLPSDGSALAAENTSPTNFDANNTGFRLRVNFAERGRSISSTSARKKLQFTNGCNPNAVLEFTCTWTDVGATGSGTIWRYKDITCTPTDCADNTLLTGTKLTGTSTCSAGLGCGAWILAETGTSTNMTLTAQSGADTVQENEYIVESNGAAGATRYYFRLYDSNFATPIHREQDANDCGGGAAQCTYPSLVTAPNTGNFMRHGTYFQDDPTGGGKQNFFWAN